MSTDKANWLWLATTAILILIIIASSLIIWTRQDRGQFVEIIPPQTLSFRGEILVDGAVANPGSYPLKENDSLAAILQASGGTSGEADLTRIHLHVPFYGEGQQPQRVDINRAEIWMLSALPDIGNAKAQAIIEYRQQNGPFHYIAEITRVPGISPNTFEKIKNMITLAD
jgi:competence protein ComEA